MADAPTLKKGLMQQTKKIQEDEMGNETVGGVHWSFWLISVLALLWNVGGAINYLMQTNLEFVATLPETHRAIIEGRPAWATGICNWCFWWCSWLPSASVQEINRTLCIYRVVAWCDSNHDPYN